METRSITTHGAIVKASTTPTSFWKAFGSCSMQYKSSIVVGNHHNIEAFKHVLLKLLLIIKRLHGHYAFDLVSPW
jgi:hypothetical protein